MSALPQVFCGPCQVASLVVPNVLDVHPERDRLTVEVHRPCCGRSVVVFMAPSWRGVLEQARDGRIDVRFEDRAQALMAGEVAR